MATTTMNQSEVKISLTLPRQVWGRMATIAEQKRCRVADLVADAVEVIVDPTPVDAVPADRDEAKFRTLSAVDRGWDDWTIAEQLGVPVSTVAKWRRDMKLKPQSAGQGKGRI